MSQDLRKAGLKVTHPRLRILELLEHAKPRHMTAEDIYKQLLAESEDIGLATIYRVLTQFGSRPVWCSSTILKAAPLCMSWTVAAPRPHGGSGNRQGSGVS